jgi:subtilase family serine protease
MAGRSRTTAAVVSALVLVVLLGSPSAATSGPSAPVRIGPPASLPNGSELIGGLAPTTRLHLTVALKSRDPAGLASYATAVSTPGSSLYRRFLSVAEFARRFGASPGSVRAVLRSLVRHGLRPGPLAANRLAIALPGSAAAIQRAFRISFIRLGLPDHRTAVEANAAPSFDPGVASSVQAVIGLSSLSHPRPLYRRAVHAAPIRPSVRPHVATGGPQPCSAARSAAPGQSALTEDQIASAYGLSGLYGGGDLGAGVTVAVYELEPYPPSDVAAYQACYGTHATVSDVHVDGGAGSGPGSGEAALDIENVIGIAPSARVLVYEGPNTGAGSAPYDTYNAIVSQNVAQVASTSWGDCEPAIGAATAGAENTLFQEAAVQGQTIISAGGDEGSEDCNGDNGIPDTSLQVEDPASQPFVTGVGGTTLGGLGPRPTESVWNNGGSLASALTQPGAGGGGVSSFWAMPAAQRDAPAALHVSQAGSSGAPCGHATGLCREVPDVSADADPSTGYLIYWNGSGSAAGQPSGWQGIGGTSAAAPTWAAMVALADASPGCAGSPIGFANPALYRAAASAFAADFNDVTSGQNDFTGSHGRYSAGPGYDMASGLGTPNGAALTATLCSSTLRILNPGAQLSTVRTAVNLRMRSADAGGFTPSFRAQGLPPGLKINGSTARITGRPRRTGKYSVTVSAQDREGAHSRAAFEWNVAGAPKASGVSLLVRGTRHQQLAFKVSVARGAPPVALVAVKPPRGLRLRSTRGVTVHGSHGVRLRFSPRITRGALTIKLRRSAGVVSVVVSAPSLRVLTARAGRLSLSLIVTDSNAGVTKLVSRIRRSA